MKKTAILLLCAACLPASSLDWKLPVFSMRYEITEGTIENPDPDEDILIPSSLRNAVSLHVSESADPLDFGLRIRYSAKDYLLRAGDYSYLSLEPDAKMKIADIFTIGLKTGAKWASSPGLDSTGLSRDYTALKGGIDVGLKPVKGTALDIGFDVEYDLYEAAVKARQLYAASAGVSSRLGEMLLSARYRGVFRLPLGGESAVDTTTLNVGSLSLQWDPNR